MSLLKQPLWFRRHLLVWRAYGLADRAARGTSKMTGEPLSDALRDRCLAVALRDYGVPKDTRVHGFRGALLLR